MAYREVSVTEIREVLRLWVRGESLRSITALASPDRKTVRRYVEAAQAAGLAREAGEAALTDELIGVVVEAVRPSRPRGRGESWERCEAQRDGIKDWLDAGVPVVKIGELLERRGVKVAQRTLHRFCSEELGYRRQKTTVRVDDGEPGGELQVDFGRMGFLVDPATSTRRVVHALIFTAVFSRHTFVWLTHRQTLQDVIAGCEAAWTFYGWVFAVLVPDNLAPVVAKADKVSPRFTDAFIEYAQARGFVIDPARVRSPQDKPRVERTVPYVRGSFFAGETFIDLADAQRRAERWCRDKAGMRIHGTTQLRPVEVFTTMEAPLLLPAPAEPYDLPIYRSAKVHRDHHIEVARALYSVPGALIGQTVHVRADSALVRISHRGQVVKVHPRMPPGRRSTDAEDLPAERTAYAMRDLDQLHAKAAGYGKAIGRYAAALLDTPLPWTRMRSVYRLFGLVHKWGPDRVEDACRRALDAEAVDVGLVGRMLERAAERAPAEPPRPEGNVVPAGSPATPTSSPSTAATPTNRWWPDDRRARADRHPRAASAAATPQARQVPRHPTRTARDRPLPQARPRRLPRTRPR